jgi:hypothetical protein
LGITVHRTFYNHQSIKPCYQPKITPNRKCLRPIQSPVGTIVRWPENFAGSTSRCAGQLKIFLIFWFFFIKKKEHETFYQVVAQRRSSPQAGEKEQGKQIERRNIENKKMTPAHPSDSPNWGAPATAHQNLPQHYIGLEATIKGKKQFTSPQVKKILTNKIC